MSSITACPQCQTRFRVTEEQLQARGGKVRCGRCAHVFNALDALAEEAPLAAQEPAPQAVTEEPAPALFPEQEAPVAPEQETGQEEVPPPDAGDSAEPLFELEITHPADLPDIEEQPFELEITQPDVPAEEPPLAAPNNTTPEPEPESRAETRVVRIQPPPVTVQPKVSPERPKYAPPPKPRRAWPWAVASLLLLTGLALQGIYFFRDAIAAHYPATRPLLEQSCAPLQCRISLPRNPDLISIESSELNADPARANIVVLSSVLRNRAPHVQAYPTLELTLTSARDEMVARILFPPEKYLRNPAAISEGIAPNSEVAVKLLLDLADLKAEGYRLYLFYPS